MVCRSASSDEGLVTLWILWIDRLDEHNANTHDRFDLVDEGAPVVIEE
jgi:hypothetical protein